MEAVGVLAGPALPRAMRVAEVDLHPGLGGQLGTACYEVPIHNGPARRGSPLPAAVVSHSGR